MSLKDTNKKLHRANIFKPIIITTIVIITTLALYIPYITDKNSIDTIIKNSSNAVEQIKLTRAYYVDNVVSDIKKYAPNIKFSYEHEGVNGVIPLPTTTIHDLSDIFSSNTGIQYNLYSEFPFKNRVDRNLTKFEKEALQFTKESPDGTYIKRDIIDGKQVLRVAVTDYMTSESCVNCHNSHPNRTWEKGKWKLGDKRGILEVITPIEDEIQANNILKYSILSLIVVLILILLGYFSLMFIRRENELFNTIGTTNVALEKEIEVSNTNQSLLEEYKNAIDMSAIVSKTDIKGTITYVNNQFCKVSEYTSTELIGKNHRILSHPDQDKKEYKKLWKTILSKEVYKGTLKNLSKSGKTYYVDMTIVPILDKDNNIIEFLSIRYDVTEHILVTSHAYTDALTGIYNRRKFEEVLSYELKQVKRHNYPITLAILDIDHFKNFNDNFGHIIGDEVLVLLARAVQEDVRETDLFARWGGEEFVILLKYTNMEESIQALEKFKTNIENILHPTAGKITASFGVTQNRENDTIDSMMRRADEALYSAKDSGRNCIKSIK